jgi:hypothetical protein
VEWRGGDGTRDDLLDEGMILTVDSMSGSKGDKSRVSTRVDTGKAGGEGECEGAAGNGEGMGSKGRNAGMVDREEGREGDDWGRGMTTWADVGEVGGEGDGQGQCTTIWSDTGKADGEGNGQQQWTTT